MELNTSNFKSSKYKITAILTNRQTIANYREASMLKTYIISGFFTIANNRNVMVQFCGIFRPSKYTTLRIRRINIQKKG